MPTFTNVPTFPHRPTPPARNHCASGRQASFAWNLPSLSLNAPICLIWVIITCIKGLLWGSNEKIGMDSVNNTENSRSIDKVVSPRMQLDYCLAHLLVTQMRKLRLRSGLWTRSEQFKAELQPESIFPSIQPSTVLLPIFFPLCWDDCFHSPLHYIKSTEVQ